MSVFQYAEAEFARLRGEFEAGKLTAEQFKHAVEANPIEHDGAYWMMGVKSGKWYRYDGAGWLEADPPLQQSPVAAPVQQRHVQQSNAVTTVAGLDKGYADGDASSARFNSPRGIAFDSDGSLLIADTGNRALRIMTSDGQVTTMVGSSRRFGLAKDGELASAEFIDPCGIAVDTAGRIIVTELRGAVRVIALDTQEVISITIKGFKFGSVPAVAAAPDGGVWISDSVENRIVWLSIGAAPRIIGGRKPGAYEDGPAEKARFDTPIGVAANAVGSVYVADANNRCIRKISKDGSVSTIAGTGPWPPFGGFRDGSAQEARFNAPHGIALDSGGRIYVADAGNNRIRRVELDSSVTTVAGSGKKGYKDGTAAEAEFNFPTAVTIGPDGVLYVLDTGNHCIRAVRI